LVDWCIIYPRRPGGVNSWAASSHTADGGRWLNCDDTTVPLLSQTAESPRQKYIGGWTLCNTRKTYSNICLIPFVILWEEMRNRLKSVKFGLDFRPQSPLTRLVMNNRTTCRKSKTCCQHFGAAIWL